MSIYISSVEFPKEEIGVLPVIIFADGSVENLFSHEKIGKAMPVPEHGRLKDYDSIYAEYKKWFDNAEYRNYESMFFALWNAFNHARIIIPSDR